MAKDTSKSLTPPVHPTLIEVLRKRFPFEFELNATDREVGYKFGVKEVIDYLERISDTQVGTPVLREPSAR